MQDAPEEQIEGGEDGEWDGEWEWQYEGEEEETAAGELAVEDPYAEQVREDPSAKVSAEEVAVPNVQTAGPDGNKNDTATAGSEKLKALLQSCADDQLLSSFPALVRALPPYAQARCHSVLRDALNREAIGVAEDDVASDKWCQLLMTPSEKKKSIRAMAMPFVTTAAIKVAVTDGKTPVTTIPDAQTKSSTSGLYVANVPYDATELQISDFFKGVVSPGRVTNVRLLLNAEGDPKGAAIVSFDSKESATKGLSQNGQLYQERKLIVKEDVIPGSKGEAKGKGKSKRKGKGKGKEKSKNPWAAKMQEKAAESQEQAVDTPDAAPDNKVTDSGEKPMTPLKSDSKSENNGCSVIVKNLAFTATEAHIGQFFAGCGEIKEVRIAKDRRSGKSKGFAVVEFAHKSHLVKACLRDNKPVCGRNVRVEPLGAPRKKPLSATEQGLTVVTKTKETVNTHMDAALLGDLGDISDDEDEDQDEDQEEEAGSKEVKEPTKTSTANSNAVSDAMRKHAQMLVNKRNAAGIQGGPPQKKAK